MPVSLIKTCSMSFKASLYLIAAALFAAISGSAAQAQFADSKIMATYKINYNGVQLGKLHFSSVVKGRSYNMETSTKLSIPLLGSIFESLSWRGVTKTSGKVYRNTPHPNKYFFAFNNGKKSGKIHMNFNGNRISKVTRFPNKKLSSAAVPVTRAHLSRVMDPMSAIMLISRKGKSHRTACSNSIPIYDGKQRFNLKLSYKRAVRINKSQSGGYVGPVIICRVQYQPIAGHKPHKKDIKFMVKNRGIELWLMPMPNSRNYAPYRFVLPLPVGKAQAELARFNIRNASGRQIALVR